MKMENTNVQRLELTSKKEEKNLQPYQSSDTNRYDGWWIITHYLSRNKAINNINIVMVVYAPKFVPTDKEITYQIEINYLPAQWSLCSLSFHNIKHEEYKLNRYDVIEPFTGEFTNADKMDVEILETFLLSAETYTK